MTSIYAVNPNRSSYYGVGEYGNTDM